MSYDIIDVFPKNRLKIELIRDIKISRNCLRITIYHYGLITTFTGSKNSMNATVIKLNPLPYSIWT
jgi:hypothetical protein